MTDSRAVPRRSGTVDADPDRMWSIVMGVRPDELRVVVYADDYDHAVVELELWCQENGVQRVGADFLRGRLHDAV